MIKSQKRNEVSCSVLQQKSCFGSAKVVGGRLRSPKRPFPGDRSALWGDMEKRLSEGSCIPCRAGHLFLQWHFSSHPFSGPVLVHSPSVRITSSRESAASGPHLPEQSGGSSSAAGPASSQPHPGSVLKSPGHTTAPQNRHRPSAAASRSLGPPAALALALQ